MITISQSTGIPELCKTEANIITPPPGIAGVQIEAATTVTVIRTKLIIVNYIP